MTTQEEKIRILEELSKTSVGLINVWYLIDDESLSREVSNIKLQLHDLIRKIRDMEVSEQITLGDQ